MIPKFLGTVIQKYRVRDEKPSRGFQEWIVQINRIVSSSLFPALKEKKMTLSQEKYTNVLGNSSYELAHFSDFNTLVALSQTHQTPIFALSEEQMAQTGVVLENFKKSRDKFREVFSGLADSIINLTTD